MNSNLKRLLAFTLAVTLVLSSGIPHLGSNVLKATDSMDSVVVDETSTVSEEPAVSTEEITVEAPAEEASSEPAEVEEPAAEEAVEQASEPTQGESTAEKPAAQEASKDEKKADTSNEEVRYEAEISELKVIATAKKGALPEGAQLQVKKLTQTEENQVEKVLDQKNVEMDDFFTVDVSFVVNGAEVEPAAGYEVSVRFEYKKSVVDDETDMSSLTVYHMEENAAGAITGIEKVADTTTAVEGDVAVNASQVVAEFDTKSFSKYTLVWNGWMMDYNRDVYFIDSNGNSVDWTGTTITVYENKSVSEYAPQVNGSSILKATVSSKTDMKQAAADTEIKRIKYDTYRWRYSTSSTGNSWTDVGNKKIYFVYPASSTPTVDNSDLGTINHIEFVRVNTVSAYINGQLVEDKVYLDQNGGVATGGSVYSATSNGGKGTYLGTFTTSLTATRNGADKTSTYVKPYTIADADNDSRGNKTIKMSFTDSNKIQVGNKNNPVYYTVTITFDHVFTVNGQKYTQKVSLSTTLNYWDENLNYCSGVRPDHENDWKAGKFAGYGMDIALGTNPSNVVINGNVNIYKTVVGVPSADLDGKAVKFTIENTETKETKSGSATISGSTATGSVSLNGVNFGSYSIDEEGDIAGYVLKSTDYVYKDASGKVLDALALSQTSNAVNVFVTNTYEKAGSETPEDGKYITVSKTFSGLESKDQIPSTYKVVVDGTEYGLTQATHPVKDGVEDPFTYIWKIEASVGKHTVKETGYQSTDSSYKFDSAEPAAVTTNAGAAVETVAGTVTVDADIIEEKDQNKWKLDSDDNCVIAKLHDFIVVWTDKELTLAERKAFCDKYGDVQNIKLKSWYSAGKVKWYSGNKLNDRITVSDGAYVQLQADNTLVFAPQSTWTMWAKGTYSITKTQPGDIAITNTYVKNNGSISFTKKSSNGGAAISGAKFTLTDKDGKVVATATSSATGAVKFENVLQGEYTLTETETPTGYKAIEPVKVTVAAGQETKVGTDGVVVDQEIRGLSFYLRLDSSTVGTSVAGQGSEAWTCALFNRAVAITNDPNTYADGYADHAYVGNNTAENSAALDAKISGALSNGGTLTFENESTTSTMTFTTGTVANVGNLNSNNPYGSTNVTITDSSFPTDAQVFDYIKSNTGCLSGHKLTVEVLTPDGKTEKVTINTNDLNTDNFEVHWYVVKTGPRSDDKWWHIDGILVPKSGTLTISKTFSGLENVEDIENLENYNLKVTGSWIYNGKSYPVAYDLKLSEGTRTVALDGSVTYTWTRRSYKGATFTLTESNYEISGYTVAATGKGTETTDKDGNKTYTDSVEIKDNGTVPINVDNKYTPVVSISGEKTWEDNNNQDGKRPTSITVDLYANGTKTNKSVPVSADKDGKWKYSFTDLPKYDADHKEITYSVKEQAVTGYTPEYSGNDIKNTHTPETKDITVEKVWDVPAAIKAEVTLPTITVNLSGTITKDGKDVAVAGTTRSITMDGTKDSAASGDRETGAWTGVFEGLPVYSEGQQIKYVVTETAPDGYTVEVTTGTTTNSQIVTNTISTKEKIDPVTITINKKDALAGGNLSGATFEATKDGKSYGVTAATDTNGKTTFTFTEAGTYVLKEKTAPAGYTLNTAEFSIAVTKNGTIDSVTLKKENNETWYEILYHLVAARDAADFDKGTLTLTVQDTPDTTKLEGEKIWVDGGKSHTNSTEVKLILSQTIDGKTTDLTNTPVWDGNKFKFEKLPVKVNGQTATYSVREDGVKDNKITINGVVYDVSQTGNAITNTIHDDKTKVEGTKTWVDGGKTHDNVSEVSITLKRKSAKAGSTEETVSGITVIKWDGKKFEFNDLPKYDSEGYEYTYSVAEAGVSADNQITIKGVVYDVSQTGNAITNTIHDDKTKVEGTKVWVDGGKTHNNAKELTMKLTRTSAKAGSTAETVKDSTGANVVPTWTGNSFKFENLPKYDSEGYEYTYTVTEDGVVNNKITINGVVYSVSRSGNTIKNTIYGEPVTISGTKTWIDGGKTHNNASELTITLTRISAKAGSTTQTVTAIIRWEGNKFEFKNLPKYDGEGYEYTYSVAEAGVSDDNQITINGVVYDVSQTGNAITNKIHDDKTTVSGTKTWDDGGKTHNNERELTITLKSKSAKAGSAEMNVVATPIWSGNTYTFSNLPKYDDEGYAYTYTTSETINRDDAADYTSTQGTGDNKYNFTNTLKRGKVTFTKQGPSGEALANVQFTLTNNADSKQTQTKATGADGSIEFADLLPGTYTLHEVAAPEGMTAITDITNIAVTAGNTTQVNNGTVTDPLVPDVPVNADSKSRITKEFTGLTTDQIDSIKDTFKITVGTIDLKLTDAVSEDGMTYTWTLTNVDLSTATITESGDYVLNMTNKYDADTDLVKNTTALEAGTGTAVTELAKDAEISANWIVLQMHTVTDGKQYLIWAVDELSVAQKNAIITAAQSTYSGLTAANSYYTYGALSATLRGGVSYGDGKLHIAVTNQWDGYVYGSYTGYAAAEIDVAVTNPYEHDYAEVSGQKYWDDAGNQDGGRPSSITIQLMADGEPVMVPAENDTQVPLTQEVTAANNWAFSFTELPKYKADASAEDGKSLISYSIVEVAEVEDPDAGTEIRPEEDYSVEYTIDEETAARLGIEKVGAYDFVNKHTPLKTSVTVNKTWVDVKEDERPEEVVFELYKEARMEEVPMPLAEGADADDATAETALIPVTDADGNQITLTVKPDADGKWTGTFEDLDKYEPEGNLIKYVVKEQDVAGYESELVSGENNVFNFKNTAKYGSIKFSKATSGGTALGDTTYAFSVVAVKDGETVYDEVIGINEAGTVTIDHLPVGAEVTITEIASGADYTPAAPVSVTVAADQVAEAAATITNEYNGKLVLGDGVVNHYSQNGGVTQDTATNTERTYDTKLPDKEKEKSGTPLDDANVPEGQNGSQGDDKKDGDDTTGNKVE